jgi:5-methylcytosine-specific restriction protein B
MEKIELQNKDGYYDCDLNITEEEWIDLINDSNVTRQNQKYVLVMFLDEAEHKSTCTILGNKYGVTSQKIENIVTSFCMAVQKKLNRYTIYYNNKAKYWPFAMKGKEVEGGYFEWILRPELASALEKCHLSWIPFYREFTEKLLSYKNRREELLDILYKVDRQFIKPFYNSDGTRKFSDMCPFSVMGIFNKGLTNENRISITKYFKEAFSISAPLPKDSDSVPVVDLRRAIFFWGDSEEEIIQLLWDLLEYTVNDKKEGIKKCFDNLLKHSGFKWNISMCLYWVKPNEYISLDTNNREYLNAKGISVFDEKELSADNYFKLLEEVKEKMGNGQLEEKDIPSFSYNAWRYYNLKKDTADSRTDVDSQELSKTDNPKKMNVENPLEERCIRYLKASYNLVLMGAPGTGKTYLAREIAKDMNAQTGFVQFHPSYDYTDFVEGLRPVNDTSNNNIGFERKDGIFKKFCKEALKQEGKNFVFIIDEINRGEISKIFGELFFSIDPGYRGKKELVNTQYQNLITDEKDPFFNGFFIPKNVYIIGTMNDIDRSVESMDFAMRRRFTWMEINVEDTQKDILSSINQKDEAIEKMEAINKEIRETLGNEYQIGAAYFLNLKNDKNDDNPFESLWEYHLKPLISEYFRGRDDKDEKIKEIKSVYDGEEHQSEG